MITINQHTCHMDWLWLTCTIFIPFTWRKTKSSWAPYLQIFLHLRNLLGKSNPTTKEGFSWILLRSKTETDADLNQIDFATVSRNCRKLHIAQKLLHECFVSIIEPRTQSDLLADLLMNKEWDSSYILYIYVFFIFFVLLMILHHV